MSLAVHHQKQESFLGQETLIGASQKYSFPEMVFLVLSGRLPNQKELGIFELMLNLSIDHGPDTPSSVVTIEAAKQGKAIGPAVGAGMSQVGTVHGGAQERLMPLLYQAVKGETSPAEIVKQIIEQGKKFPGFGHRLYKKNDPRADLILARLLENGLGREFVVAAQTFQSLLLDLTGKFLPLNIDGAIAVTLCTFNWEPRLGQAFFLVARTPGLCAHYLNSH